MVKYFIEKLSIEKKMKIIPAILKLLEILKHVFIYFTVEKIKGNLNLKNVN